MAHMAELRQITALFVATGGSYFGLPGVDPWDVEHDARLYAGPDPVVAHPPCQLWVNFAALNFKRYGGEHNRPGNDGGCFEAALHAVRKYGGVLEHPAGSNAWKRYGLTPPSGSGWTRADDYDDREWICEVWQSAYGHRARKRTWLLWCGGDAGEPLEMNWSREPGLAQVGWFDRIKPTLSKREAMATPPAFRDALIELARHSQMRPCQSTEARATLSQTRSPKESG
jgi:hypothetical protein